MGLLASIDAPILGEIAKPILGKIFGRGRRLKQKKTKTMRKKIVLKRKTTPKVVTLTNGTTFTARYERISRKNLPTNIKVKKTRTIGPTTQRKKVRFTSSRSLRERLRKIQRVTTCTNW